MSISKQLNLPGLTKEVCLEKEVCLSALNMTMLTFTEASRLLIKTARRILFPTKRPPSILTNSLCKDSVPRSYQGLTDTALPSTVPFPGHLPPSTLVLHGLVQSHGCMAHLRRHLQRETLSSPCTLQYIMLLRKPSSFNIYTFPTPMDSSMFTIKTILNIMSSSPSS